MVVAIVMGFLSFGVSGDCSLFRSCWAPPRYPPAPPRYPPAPPRYRPAPPGYPPGPSRYLPAVQLFCRWERWVFGAAIPRAGGQVPDGDRQLWAVPIGRLGGGRGAVGWCVRGIPASPSAVVARRSLASLWRLTATKAGRGGPSVVELGESGAAAQVGGGVEQLVGGFCGGWWVDTWPRRVSPVRRVRSDSLGGSGELCARVPMECCGVCSTTRTERPRAWRPER